MPKFQILPAETRFYDLFEQHAQTLQRAARQLRELVEDFHDVDGKFAQLTETEHQGDFITHEVIDLARRSFLAPFDTEDVTAIAGRIDDGIDGIQQAADTMILWKVVQPRPEAAVLCRIIEQGADEIAAAVPNLRDKRRFDQVRAHIVEVNRLENEADRIARGALSAVLAKHDDVYDLLRWKEIYDQLEAVTDRLEDVADVLEGITVKHG
jgi:predicted phosphate transport protein (TIGR00153 family)